MVVRTVSGRQCLAAEGAAMGIPAAAGGKQGTTSAAAEIPEMTAAAMAGNLGIMIPAWKEDSAHSRPQAALAGARKKND